LAPYQQIRRFLATTLRGELSRRKHKDVVRWWPRKHDVALVSLPALGVVGQQRHAREVIVGLVEELLGWLGGIRAS
jgi:hypothetical protein